MNKISFQNNQNFTLSPGQENTIEGTDMSLYLLDIIEDSRCPSDVVCVTAGTVMVSLNVKQKNVIINQYPLTISLGGTQDINDEYILKFVNVTPDRGKQFEQIDKKQYQAVFAIEPKHRSLPSPVIEMKDPNGAIFPKESLPPHNFKRFQSVGAPTIGYWTPSLEEAQKADDLVKRCVVAKEQTIEQKLKDYMGKEKESEKAFYLEVLKKIEPVYSEYMRQYIGYLGQNGHKLIWINFFLSDDIKGWDWKKEIIQPPMTSRRSGYHGFFDVLVDLNDLTCVHFTMGN